MSGRTRPVVAVLLAVVVVGAAVPAPVAGQSDSGPDPFGALGGDGKFDASAWAVASANAIVERLGFQVAATIPGGDEPASATDAANGVQSFVNGRSAAFRTWANDTVANGTNKSATNVVRLRFRDDAGETATRVVVLGVNQSNNSYTNLSVVDSTDRTVDAEVRLSPYATSNAEDEIRRIYRTAVADGERPPQSLQRELAAKYGASIEVERDP